MIDKKKFLMAFKLCILVMSLLLIVYYTPSVFSRYQSTTSSIVPSNIAFYLLSDKYYTQSMKISDIEPRSEAYIYSFTVSNNDNNRRSETNLEYDLSIITTTNLPLTYELYMNENPNDVVGTSTIVTDITSSDADGTYFKTITTSKQTFVYTDDQTNIYYLVVHFDPLYKDYTYQNIVEYVEIVINSRQIIE